MAPGAGIGPAAQVVAHILACGDDGIVNGRVLFLLVQAGMVAAAVIYLDEVEVQLLEVEVGIHLFVAVEAHVGVLRVAVADAAAGAVARIAVDAGLQALGVNIVAHHLQAAGEALGMDAHLPLCSAAILEAVVDVDVQVARILQSLGDHSIGLTLDDVFRNVHRESVP